MKRIILWYLSPDFVNRDLMGSLRKIIIVLGLCLSQTAIHAQNLKFQSFLVESGLSNNSVNKIVNDATGALWIGTWDGLNYFDGKTFEVFRHDPADSTSLPGNFILGLTRDIHGKVWVQTSAKAISFVEEMGSFKNFYFDENISTHGLSETGELLVRLTDKNLVYRQGRFQPCTDCKLQPDKTVELADILKKAYPTTRVLDVHTDNKGNIWFATLRDGLFVLSVKNGDMSAPAFHQYKLDPFNPYSLKSNEIYDIHEDIFGNIWLAMKDGGISMAFKNSDEIFSVYPHPKLNPALPNETIRAITQDKENRVWLGFYNAGLFYNEPGQPAFRPFNPAPPDNSEDWKRVRSLYTDSHGAIWVGTYAGVMYIAPDHKVKFYSPYTHPNLVNDRTYDFVEDENNLWIACWGGLAKFNYEKGEFVTFEGQGLMQKYHIRKLLKDEGIIYIATERNGLIKFTDGKTESIGIKQGLLDESVYDIWKDETSGNLWIATLGGISVYHPEKGLVKNLDQKTGLQSQFVYVLLSNGQNVWASTTNGITVIDKSDYSVNILPWSQGWQGAEFSEGAYFQNDFGTIFFGGVNGLNYFHPNRINIAQDLPLIYLEEFPDWRNDLMSGKFTMQVKTVSFSQSSDNQVVYRLEPYQNDWQVLNADGVIIFDDLPAGHYTLKVGNSKNLKEEYLRKIAVNIPEPIWKSPPFLLLTGAILVILILFLRYRNVRSVQVKLEARIAERTKTIESQKDRLEAKNKEISTQKAELLALYQRHKDDEFEVIRFKQFFLNQFRTPLIEFKEGFDLLKSRDNQAKAELNNQLERVLVELKQWDQNHIDSLDHTGIQGRSLTLLPELLEDLADKAKRLLSKYKVVLREELYLVHDWVELDVLKFKMFGQYLFQEIIKYLSATSSVSLCVREIADELIIEVQIPGRLFLDAFDDIWEFSPYINSCRELVRHMGGTIIYEKNDEFVALNAKIPFQPLKTASGSNHFKHWKHLEMAESLSDDKRNILLLSKRYEFDLILKVIQNDKFEILLEDDIEMVKSGIDQLDIDALIIYNRKVDNQIAELIKQLKDKKFRVPVVYIHEDMSNTIREKLIDLGADTLVQLPVNKTFLFKQITALIEAGKALVSQNPVASLLSAEEHNVPLTPNEKLVREGLQIIKENLGNADFKVNKLSEQLQVSQMKCYRIFKEVLNTSPSDLIVQLRLEKAESLIHKKSLNISEVSYSCGFNDPKYFSKVFKKHFGSSPKNYKVS